MIISLVVALDCHGLIGKNQSLPWHAPADLAHFKAITMGKPIVMGRKTCETLAKPLPGRQNLVLTQNPNYTREGFEIFHSMEAILEYTKAAEELMIIGGAKIYEIFLPYAHKVYVTIVDGKFNGDTWFPSWPLTGWREIRSSVRPPDERNPHQLTFSEFEKVEKK